MSSELASSAGSSVVTAQQAAACHLCGRPTPQDEDRSIHLKVVRQSGKDAHVLHRWHHPDCAEYVVEAHKRWKVKQETAAIGDMLSRAGAGNEVTEQTSEQEEPA